MARSGQEIQEALRLFVKRWRAYAGTERAEAQTFLNELFECFRQQPPGRRRPFEDFNSSSGFMDLHWPGICIIWCRQSELVGSRAVAVDDRLRH